MSRALVTGEREMTREKGREGERKRERQGERMTIENWVQKSLLLSLSVKICSRTSVERRRESRKGVRVRE